MATSLPHLRDFRSRIYRPVVIKELLKRSGRSQSLVIEAPRVGDNRTYADFTCVDFRNQGEGRQKRCSR